MFARLAATLGCVSLVGLSSAHGEAAASVGRNVDVYLVGTSSSSSEPLLEMKRQTTQLLAAAGYGVSWHNPSDASASQQDPLFVVELRGSCQPASSFNRPAMVKPGTSLGSSALSNGQIQPFGWLECGVVARFLDASLRDQPQARRNSLYGRALGRILAHELLHYLTNTREHDTDGVGKASFSAKDVLADRFELSDTSVERLKDQLLASGDEEDDTPAETAVGR